MPELTQAQKESIVRLFTRKNGDESYSENTYKWISTPIIDNYGVAVVQCWYDYKMTSGITIGVTTDGGTHS